MSWVAPLGLTPKRNVAVAMFDAQGAGTATISNQNSATIWVVVQLSLIMVPTASGGECVVRYPNGIMDTAYFAGTGDQAGGEPEFLYADDYLTLDWTAGQPGGQGIATFQYYELPL